jgi:Cu-processing system permease protein
VVQNIPAGLALMLLQGLSLLSVTILGGTRLSTLANGVLAFMLFGIAFLGSWIEQIGALFQNETAVDIGILTSLLLPTEVLWRRAAEYFVPTLAASPIMSAGPFVLISRPSPAMTGYAVFYTVTLLLLALISFSRRDL